ncbi:MAG: transporter ATP-binding protein [Desulfomicrobiaceae bacterium]|jgi:lipopolysaccharide transport system ATP-binding protein|nr:transporter ATP-binding protein [Desulfomicrobiaceae bacterium]
MSSNLAVCAHNLGKCYHIYAHPRHRLQQMLLPPLRRLLRRPPRTYYHEFWALQDVTLTIARGETVGIIGRNGSGKSTLLQMICGTLTPTCGQVSAQGRVAALLELGSGFNPEFSGEENVYLNASLLGLSHQEIRQRFDAIAAFADIGDYLSRPVKTYSSGMLVRLAFAVMAHVDADILVVDEALAVGDAVFTQKCMRFLRRFQAQGTILLVTHDTTAVLGLCSRAVWLHQGRVRADGAPKEVCGSYLEFCYSTQQDTAAVRHAPAPPPPAPPQGRDQRQDLLNHSNLRNDLRLFSFDPQAPAFGAGGARVTRVELTDTQGRPLLWAVGGEAVILQIQVQCLRHLASPIVGFFIKDRLGQPLFGDNTYLSTLDRPVPCPAGGTLTARFHFQMPRLAVGDYAVTVAVADGTQEQHVQHQWVHEALVFRAESSSVAGGLIGIPMTRIDLEAARP